MAIRVYDIGELAYGSLVTGARELDANRMVKGTLSEADVMKKFETYAYLVPGGLATIMSAFGVWRRYEPWLEPVQHGFIYAFPQFLVNTVRSMSGTTARSAAVREAQRIINGNGTATRYLGDGNTGRTYQPEFKRAIAW